MLGFVFRWAVAFVLLTVSFNPTEFNYASWATVNFDRQMSLAVLLGL